MTNSALLLCYLQCLPGSLRSFIDPGPSSNLLKLAETRGGRLAACVQAAIPIVESPPSPPGKETSRVQHACFVTYSLHCHSATVSGALCGDTVHRSSQQLRPFPLQITLGMFDKVCGRHRMNIHTNMNPMEFNTAPAATVTQRDTVSVRRQ